MDGIETYVIGQKPVPYWYKKILMPYKKMDGSTGYEFHGRFRSYELNVGDLLIKEGHKIKAKRKEFYGCEKISASIAEIRKDDIQQNG